MQSQFCEWCGAPAVEGRELCKNCLDAQRANESKNNKTSLTPVHSTTNAPRKPLQTVGSILAAVGRAFITILLGFAMVLAGLFGTCSAILAGASLSSPAQAATFAFMALMGSVFAVLAYKGLTRKRPKEIDRIAKAGTDDV